MYKKLIFAGILIVFACVQFGNSLDCFECNGESDCKANRKVSCNQNRANNTVLLLNQKFRGVQNTTSSNYDCLHVNYTQVNGASAFAIKGCVYRETQSCNLTPLDTTLAKQNCTTCSGNFCNGRNPAATFSSSAFTLLGSAIIVLVAKMSLL